MNTTQKHLARHALGLDGHRKSSYRNRYAASPGSPEDREWFEMMKAGEAEIHKMNIGMTHLNFYSLTDQGAKAALNEGEYLDAEDFPDKETT